MNLHTSMKIKLLVFLICLATTTKFHAQNKNEYVKREFAMCSFNELIANSQKGSMNKKLETIEIHDFNSARTFYWINDSIVIGCFIFDLDSSAVVKCSWIYQNSTDSLMIDTFLKGGKTKESVLEYDKPCLDCPAVSHVIYKIKRRRCPKVIRSTIIIHSY